MIYVTYLSLVYWVIICSHWLWSWLAVPNCCCESPVYLVNLFQPWTTCMPLLHTILRNPQPYANVHNSYNGRNENASFLPTVDSYRYFCGTRRSSGSSSDHHLLAAAMPVHWTENQLLCPELARNQPPFGHMLRESNLRLESAHVRSDSPGRKPQLAAVNLSSLTINSTFDCQLAISHDCFHYGVRMNWMTPISLTVWPTHWWNSKG